MREIMRQYPQYAEGGESRPAPVWHGVCAAILARTQWGVDGRGDPLAPSPATRQASRA